MAQIIRYPDEILLQKSKTVEKFDKNLVLLGDELLKYLDKSGGIGLAAVQLGEPLRLVAFSHPKGKTGKTGHILLANPEIVKTEGNILDIEGCFSLPGLWLEIERPESVEVKAQLITGAPFSARFTGYLARGMMHEIDHLEGRLIWDLLPGPKRKETVKNYLSTAI